MFQNLGCNALKRLGQPISRCTPPKPYAALHVVFYTHIEHYTSIYSYFIHYLEEIRSPPHSQLLEIVQASVRSSRPEFWKIYQVIIEQQTMNQKFTRS